MSADFRVRFAPSPTGYLHIGGARTALFNWLLARQKKGVFVLRMEDTDEARNTDAARQTIFRGLDWLRLTPDEGPEQGGPYGPYSQSERAEIYREHAEILKAKGALYPCFCSRERLSELRTKQEATKSDLGYDQLCRGIPSDEAERRMAAGEEATWRLKVPEGATYRLPDLVRGEVTVESKDIEDIILLRANGVPIYNFVVVVDDHLMKISHVLRGEDHLTNTFKQLLIYEAFGWDTPQFGHLPLILGPTGEGKLSKRKHPEAALELYQDKGYPVEGLVNWLALIGWSFDGETEIMSRDELIERFDIDKVASAGARLPLDKLDWISGDTIRRQDLGQVVAGIEPFLAAQGWSLDETGLQRLAAAYQERLRTYSDIVEMARWLFEESPEFEDKARKNLAKDGVLDLLAAYGPVLLDGDFSDPAALESSARDFCEREGVGFGKLVHPVRAALTRRTSGPGLFDCAVLLGRDRCERRVAEGLEVAREKSA
ncbi:MAG: glutamate--tRNA ligase [Planctomycetes bacterium]|nr:glutamate--tRNA ligase [Planctomycetota bacterium]